MMKHAILLCLALCAPASAQPVTQDEIAFWETVRDSRNAAELQAYIDTYPKGKFVVLARARLAALAQQPAAQPPAPQPQAAPPVAAAAPATPGELRAPRPGDTWTYRLSPVRKWGSPPSGIKAPRTVVVTANSVVDKQIIDQVSVDGARSFTSTHGPGRTLLRQDVSVLSPYLLAFEKLPTSGRLGPIAITDCGGNFICEAKGRVVGQETVRVAAGSFVATKVIVDQEWRPRSVSGHAAGQLNGGRTLTVWYAPEIGRAVKYSSRLVVGDIPAVEPNFDLELVSFQAK
jgi:hypothetical protein